MLSQGGQAGCGTPIDANQGVAGNRLLNPQTVSRLGMTKNRAAGLLILNQAACPNGTEGSPKAEQMHCFQKGCFPAAIAAVKKIHSRPRLYGNLAQIAQSRNFQSNQGHEG